MRWCAALAATAVLLSSPALARSKAADYLVREEIAGACDGGNGTINDSAVIERDLNGDGKTDLIIAHDGIKCANGSRSNACGMVVCTVNIYIREGALLKLMVDDPLGAGVTVGNGKFPLSAWSITPVSRTALNGTAKGYGRPAMGVAMLPIW